jgi:AraC-like DNA-binding protein
MIDAIDQFAASMGVVFADLGADDISSRWDALEAAGTDLPGLAFAQWVDLTLVGGVIPALLANCATVGSVLEMLARFHPLWGNDEIVLKRSASGGMSVALRGPEGVRVHPQTEEAFYAIVAKVMAALAVSPLRSARQFTKADLSIKIGSADPTVARMLVGYAETQIDDLGESWVAVVRREVRVDLGPSLTLARVAARLAQSPRTLQQRLFEGGTSFSALVDDERRMHALGLLAHSDLAVSAVGIEAGFGSLEGFSRAVRRWTGMSPTEWRSGGSADVPIV